MFGTKMRLATALTVLGVVSVAGAQTPQVGKTFPDFSEKDAITGETVSLKGLRGRMVLLDFWATWCGPCRAALPHVVEAQKRFAKKGFVVVSISLDKEEKREEFKEFVKENEMNWPHVMDGKFWEAKLAKKYGIRGIPAVFLIDPNGKCIGDSKTLMVHDEEAFFGKIEEALKETPATEKSLLPAMKKWIETEELALKDRAEADRKEREAEETKKLASAEKLLKQKKYTEAIKAFEKLGEEYPEDAICQKAAAKAKSLKADKKVQFAIMSAEANRRAPGMMKMAKQLAENGNMDKAKQYYQMVMDKYPGTPHAEQAKAALEGLGN